MSALMRMESNATYILALNGGSSSIKFALFDRESLKKVFKGKLDRIGMDGTYITLTDLRTGEEKKESAGTMDPLTLLSETVASHIQAGSISAIGHRVVHGGTLYRDTTLVDEHVIASLETLAPFAPRHLPSEIAILQASMEAFPNIPQFACFDTTFFRDLPRMAQIIALPHTYEAQGVRRYGFHGLSYEYLMHHLADELHESVQEKKIVLAHLGSGASLAAVAHGKPVETSMGLTPASGIPMGTRSGDLDPGVFEYFTTSLGFSPEKFSHMVNFESGSLGISGITADMEVLLQRAHENERAEEAVAFFCYQARKYIGSFTAAMGGIDTLVFTGGMGELASEIRRRICTDLAYLGLHVDTAANAANAVCISSSESRVRIYVIPTDEELIIARHAKESSINN